MGAPIDVVAVLSLEPWDDVWRRNQHLAAALLDGGHVGEVIFVEPPRVASARGVDVPGRGVEVVRPPLVLPRRLGGLAAAAAWLRATSLRRATSLWVNDAPLGVHLLGGRPAVYDVTDDWRATRQPDRVKQRLIRAEDRLARSAATVVCSEALRSRWQERYGVPAVLVPNAVDPAAWRDVTPRELPRPGPHLGYVGTLHDERLDVDLVLALAAAVPAASVHLVGPDHLRSESRSRLAGAGVDVVGSVPAAEVPSWLAAFDVLLCPHVVSEFTLSLDAIKAYEYVASGRPVVATATSGFQLLATDVVSVSADGPDFVARVRSLLVAGRRADQPGPVGTWAERAALFAAILGAGQGAGQVPGAPTRP